LGILSSRIRKEEKTLIKEARGRKELELEVIDPRERIFDPREANQLGDRLDVLLDREISQSRAYHILEMLRTGPVRLINTFETVRICGDKAFTSAVLEKAGVPTPDFRVAFDRKGALEALEDLGYPAVLKPVDGSWGRMLAKINDRDAAEAVFEHKSGLDSHFHDIFYLQDYVEKSSRDIRAYVIGDEVVGAAYRVSDHWVTNAARGGKAHPCEVGKELEEICLRAAAAVGGGALAVDLMETAGGFTVNEINCSMEFKESMKVLKKSVPSRLIDYCLAVGADGEEPTSVQGNSLPSVEGFSLEGEVGVGKCQ